MKPIDIETWNRKEHFEFFSKYDNPFFGLVTEIDSSRAYERAKANSVSFFAYYLHKSIVAINQVDELKLRTVNEQVVTFDRIHAGTTIGRADGTFGFSFTAFSPDFEAFAKALKQEIDVVQQTTGLRANEDAHRPDVIHYSTFPWHKFTGLTHARNFNDGDSVPKITFGKTFSVGSRLILPVAIDVHHGLADGFHVAQFLTTFQQLMDE